jgi:quercetin dioxygenase-like cupin family protein
MRDDKLSLAPLPTGWGIRSVWASDTHPADPNSHEDKSLLNMGFHPTGSSLNIVDIPPQSKGDIHRSLTLDYTVVLKGRITLVLDDGSRTSLGEGDVVVLQAGMHAWDNETDQWARLMGVLLPSKPPLVNGEELEEMVNF